VLEKNKKISFSGTSLLRGLFDYSLGVVDDCGATGWSDPSVNLPYHFGPPLDREVGTAPPQ